MIIVEKASRCSDENPRKRDSDSDSPRTKNKGAQKPNTETKHDRSPNQTRAYQHSRYNSCYSLIVLLTALCYAAVTPIVYIDGTGEYSEDGPWR